MKTLAAMIFLGLGCFMPILLFYDPPKKLSTQQPDQSIGGEQ